MGIAGGNCLYTHIISAFQSWGSFGFGAHQPVKVHKMLLETRLTGLMMLQAASEWNTHMHTLTPPTGIPAGFIKWKSGELSLLDRIQVKPHKVCL